MPERTSAPPPGGYSPTPRPIQAYRSLRLALHLLWIALGTALAFPCLAENRQRWLRQRWARQALDILSIRLDVQDFSLADTAPGSLIVANHVSWLDIFVLNAARPVAFVSKAEVRQWPFIGWLATRNDTVFLRRGSRGHAKVVNAEIDALLNAGKDVAIFPEGTTTDGTHVLHFHAALLQPAVETGHPIQPLALSYHAADGQRSLAPSYAGETTMRQSFAAVLACRVLSVRLRAMPALDPQNSSRRELAQAARSAIGFSLGLPLASNRPETARGLPAEPRSDDGPTDSPNPAPVN